MNVNQNVVQVLEQDSSHMDFTNVTITAAASSLTLSGSYIHDGQTYQVSGTLPFPATPDNAIINEWNLVLWTTDHSFHLEIGQFSRPPEDRFAVAIVAFGWLPGTACSIPCDLTVWHIKPKPYTDTPRPGQGVHSSGRWVYALSDGKRVVVRDATVQQPAD